MLEKINVMLDDGAIMPTRAHDADAGLDLYTPREFVLYESSIVDTGVHVEIPIGYVGMIKSKSGLNVKHNITAEGVIDSGFSGSIVVKMYNYGENPHKFNVGDKITQLVILPIETPEPVLVDSFVETERGNAGFGSTGT